MLVRGEDVQEASLEDVDEDGSSGDSELGNSDSVTALKVLTQVYLPRPQQRSVTEVENDSCRYQATLDRKKQLYPIWEMRWSLYLKLGIHAEAG